MPRLKHFQISVSKEFPLGKVGWDSAVWDTCALCPVSSSTYIYPIDSLPLQWPLALLVFQFHLIFTYGASIFISIEN